MAEQEIPEPDTKPERSVPQSIEEAWTKLEDMMATLRLQQDEAKEAAAAGAAAMASLATTPVTDEMLREVRDAMELLEYAVAVATKRETEADEPVKIAVDESLMRAIKDFAAAIADARQAANASNVAAASTAAGATTAPRAVVTVESWVKFEAGYNGLAKLVSPVTIQTLRDTDNTAPTSIWRSIFIGNSPVTNFGRWIWLATFFFVGVVLVGEFWIVRYGPMNEGEVDRANDILQVFQVVSPFAYGGLGACAYLLRSAHRYIHERTFDLRRMSEYWNRILLGAISGGSIILFFSEGLVTEGGTFRLSTAALGFVAGYSSDFLFSTIERVVKVLLPKVDVSTIRRAPEAPQPPSLNLDVTAKDLLDRYQAATDPGVKAMLKALIEKHFQVKVE